MKEKSLKEYVPICFYSLDKYVYFKQLTVFFKTDLKLDLGCLHFSKSKT